MGISASSGGETTCFKILSIGLAHRLILNHRQRAFKIAPLLPFPSFTSMRPGIFDIFHLCISFYTLLTLHSASSPCFIDGKPIYNYVPSPLSPSFPYLPYLPHPAAVPLFFPSSFLLSFSLFIYLFLPTASGIHSFFSFSSALSSYSPLPPSPSQYSRGFFSRVSTNFLRCTISIYTYKRRRSSARRVPNYFVIYTYIKRNVTHFELDSVGAMAGLRAPSGILAVAVGVGGGGEGKTWSRKPGRKRSIRSCVAVHSALVLSG